MNTPPVELPKTDPSVEKTGEFESDDPASRLDFLDPPQHPGSLGRLGHYEILEVLGRGGFGIVFRALDTVLQRTVAVKVLSPEMAATSPARKRFLREARAAAQVRHDNVVQIHAIEEQPLPFIVMEFVPGESLQHRLDRIGPLDAVEIVPFARQLASGLAAAHDAGLIHRDIKPANILIEPGPQQRLKITDFGLARAADDASITRSGIVAGTPMYMSPEQARGERLDPRSDLFSLGSVLYSITSGHPPFRACNTLAILKRVTEDEPRPIAEVIPESPEWLCRLIARLMAKNPADRFQSAAEVVEALDAKHLATTVFSPLQSTRRRRSRLLAGAALAAIGVAIVALYLANRPKTGATGGGTRLVLTELEPDKKDAVRDTPKTAPTPYSGQPVPPYQYTGLRAGALSPDGTTLAASLSVLPGRGLVQFWDVATGKTLGPPLVAAKKIVLGLAFSHDGKRLAAVSLDQSLTVWEVATWTKVNTFELDNISSLVQFSPDGKWLAVGWTNTDKPFHEGWVTIWNAQTLDEVASFQATTSANGADLHALAFSADGMQLAVGTITGELRLWNPATRKEIGKPRRLSTGIYSLAFSPDSQLAVGGVGSILIAGPEDAEPRQIPDGRGMIFATVFSRDGNSLAWTGESGDVYVRDGPTKRTRKTLDFIGESRCLVLTPDGKRVIAGAMEDGNPPRAWDLETEREQEAFELPKGALRP